MNDEYKSRVHSLERKVDEVISERDAVRNETKQKIDRLIELKQKEMIQRIEDAKKELVRKHEEELNQVRAEAQNVPPVDPQVLENQIREKMEAEFLERLRDREALVEQQIKESRDESKKEIDKSKWENESMKDELKRAREARAQIEHEAQDLLRQAEDHYKNELSKRLTSISDRANKNKGFFSAIGRFLDTPIIEFGKKKDKKSDL